MRHVSQFCLVQEKVESGLGSVLDYCCSCSVTQSCPALCHRMDCNMPGFPVLPYFPDFAQTHVCCVNDAIQPSYLMSVKEQFLISVSTSCFFFFFYLNLMCCYWKILDDNTVSPFVGGCFPFQGVPREHSRMVVCLYQHHMLRLLGKAPRHLKCNIQFQHISMHDIE